jgi:hypothetical protein
MIGISIMTKLKLVKKAHIEGEFPFMYVKHYDTLLIKFNLETREAHVLKGLSPISNTQIKYFIEAFNPLKIIDDNENFKRYPKNYFSRSI